MPGTPAPFIVAQDGGGYLKTLPPVLDNLIHERRLPVMVAVLINSGADATWFLDAVTTNYVPVLRVGQGSYSFILDPAGAVIVRRVWATMRFRVPYRTVYWTGRR